MAAMPTPYDKQVNDAANAYSRALDTHSAILRQTNDKDHIAASQKNVDSALGMLSTLKQKQTEAQKQTPAKK